MTNTMRAAVIGISLFVAFAGLAEPPLIGTQQTFPLPGSDKMLVSPSETQVALVAQHQTKIYAFDEIEQKWKRHEADLGFLGTSSEPWKLAGIWPLFGWTVTGQQEVFIPNLGQGKGIAIRGGNVETVQVEAGITRAPFDAESPKVPGVWTLRPQEQRAFVEEAYSLLKDRAVRLRQNKAVSLERELPESINYILDISRDGTRAICRVTEDKPLTSLNLLTGETADFPIHDRPRTLPADATASYSPDGRYVLVQYLYGPDDHYAGGYLQLFTADGLFVTELAEYSDEAGYPAGFCSWLSNGWVIYGDGRMLHFVKLTLGSP